MSTQVGSVRTRRHAGPEQGPGLRDEIHVNRFAGGLDGVCSQITIGGLYVQLDMEGRAELVRLLQFGAPAESQHDV